MAAGRGFWERTTTSSSHSSTPARQIRARCCLLNDTFGHGRNRQRPRQRIFRPGESREKEGAPIDVVGTEMHWRTAATCVQRISTNSRCFWKARVKAGVKVHITEMDVYQGPDGYPQEVFSQAERDLLQRGAHLLEGRELHRVHDVGNREIGTAFCGAMSKNYTNAKQTLLTTTTEGSPLTRAYCRR